MPPEIGPQVFIDRIHLAHDDCIVHHQLVQYVQEDHRSLITGSQHKGNATLCLLATGLGSVERPLRGSDPQTIQAAEVCASLASVLIHNQALIPLLWQGIMRRAQLASSKAGH